MIRLASETCWPRERERLLLHAARGNGPEVARLLGAWEDSGGFDAVDPPSFCLLPQAYLAARRAGVELKDMGKLQGVYRMVCARNTLALHALDAALRVLADANVPTMVIKGAALLVCHYRDPGARFMVDADLLVRPEDRGRALAALRRAGWNPTGRCFGPALPFMNGIAVRHHRWPEVDLHWRPFVLSTPPHAEEAVWRRAVPFDIAGARTLRPDDDDLLLQACVRRSDLHGRARWVVDALLLIDRTREQADWDERTARAADLGVLPAFRDAMAYLLREFPGSVPEEAVRRMWAVRVRPRDEAAYARTYGSPRLGSLRGKVTRLWGRYVACLRARREHPGWIGFLRFLLIWVHSLGRTRRFGDVVPYALALAAARLRDRAGHALRGRSRPASD